MRPSILETAAGIAGGAIGGAIGTLVIQQEIGFARKLPDALRMPEMHGDPAEVILNKAELLANQRVPEAARARALSGLHFAYGIAWPMLLALVEPFWRSRSVGRVVLKGALLGALVWGAGYLGWLPRTGLLGRVREERATRQATALLAHAVYGVVAALPIFAAQRMVARRRRLRLRRLIRRFV
jgi:hypothetical protein